MSTVSRYSTALLAIVALTGCGFRLRLVQLPAEDVVDESLEASTGPDGGDASLTCPDGSASNGMRCIDILNDIFNCGAVGRTCEVPRTVRGEALCVGGMCRVNCSRQNGFLDCDGDVANGCEADLQQDPQNCGMCGARCPDIEHGMPACVTGRCRARCSMGFGDCNNDILDGCEADLTSPDTCRTCTNRCTAGTNARGLCSGAGTCTQECLPGFADCDGLSTNGCEANLAGSQNCGMCGMICGGATNQCVRGMMGGAPNCQSLCPMGTTACGMEGCVDLNADPRNCGTCGSVCQSSTNATGVCMEGQCRNRCFEGYDDCDGNAANGCEQNLRTSPGHCGMCNNECTAPSNANAVCAGSRCSFQCRQGFSNCDNQASNGCEVMLGTAMNCSRCGESCLGGTICCPGRGCVPQGTTCN